MNIKSISIILSVAAMLGGCTSTVRVMPGDDDLVRVVAKDAESYRAEKSAYRAAVKYCQEQDQVAVFLKDQVWYEGAMDERRRESIRRQSQAVAAAGVILRSADHDHDNEAARILESAGAAGSTMTSGKDYTAEIWLRCDRPLSARQL